MMYVKLQKIILAAFVLSGSFLAAYDWKPIGDLVIGGYAFNNGPVYADGDRIVDTTLANYDGASRTRLKTEQLRKALESKIQKRQVDETRQFSNKDRCADGAWEDYLTCDGDDPRSSTPSGNGGFNASPTDGVLNIYGTLNGVPGGVICPLKIDGDVLLSAITNNITVNLMTDVIFEPYLDPTSPSSDGLGGTHTGNSYSQLQFYAERGRQIVINIDHDLTFRGITIGPPGPDGVVNDLYLSFVGPGQTIFKMADGTTIKFDGDLDSTQRVDLLSQSPCTYTLPGISHNAGGTKVYIVMDQTKTDIDSGINKVIFQRKTYANESKRVLVYVGHNSLITYVSDDPTGIAHKTNPAIGGYGSLAFDVSNQGSGRMVFFIRGTKSFGWEQLDGSGDPLYTSDEADYYKVVGTSPFNDGSMIVAGNWINSYAIADIRSTINYSVPAGGQALFNVIDNVAYANRPSGAPYNPGPADRRGLLVINDVDTVSKLASDPYRDYYRTSSGAGIDRALEMHYLSDEAASEVLFSPKNEPDDSIVDMTLFEKPLEKQKQSVATQSNDLREKLNKIRNNKKKELLRSGFDEGVRTGPTIYGHDWSYSNGVLTHGENLKNTRFGFVVGVNGSLRVNHGTVFDYAAGSINSIDWLAQNDNQNYSGTNKSCKILKGRNPSGLILDGLDVGLFNAGVSSFVAANPFVQLNPSHPEILLYGDGAVMLRQCGDSNLGYMVNFWQLESRGRRAMNLLRSFSPTGDSRLKNSVPLWYCLAESEIDLEANPELLKTRTAFTNPLNIEDLDYQAALVLARSTFNGYNLALEAGTISGGTTCMGGDNVIEVQGASQIHSLSNTAIIDQRTNAPRSYAAAVANSGTVCAKTIEIDYTCAEVGSPRPLAISSTSYNRYNSPLLFFNNHLGLYNTTLINSDLTKRVDGLPNASYPAFVGGERFVFSDATQTYDSADRDRYRFPELRLYNSTLALQESLNIAGVRVVVRDDPSPTQTANTSILQFFDHGDALDTTITGHGRILMLGSQNNTMADGLTHDWITESAFINIFKYNPPVGGATPTQVTLSLQNGNQFPSSVNPSNYFQQRANQLVLFSVLPNGTSNLAAGWPTVATTSPIVPVGYSDDSFPYTNTLYGDTTYVEQPGSHRFSVDAFTMPPAALSIDGHYISFSGFDESGNGVIKPVTTLHDNALYIEHGGKITVTQPPGDAFTSLPYQTAFDAMVAQKVWGDFDVTAAIQQTIYSGIIDLPHDQATYCLGCAVQPVGIAQAMTHSTGFLRLNFYNPTRPILADTSGAADVVINLANDLDVRSRSVAKKQLKKPRFHQKSTKNVVMRNTETVGSPVAPPTSVMTIGPGDFVNQLAVAGSSQATPLILAVVGGRVRELVSTPVNLTTYTTVGSPGIDVDQGSFACINIGSNGRCGLGSIGWNTQSIGAFNLLGYDSVQIAPIGDGTVDVNSDLIVIDSLPLVATTAFGASQVNRLTFYSETEKEIRILANNTLDLSAFGQASYQQQIMFDGKVKLVIEAGAKIRFPSNPVGGVVLYFNGESQLIFEAASGPRVYSNFFADSAAANVTRTKLVGKGQLWANQQAKIQVNGLVLVGVQSDSITPVTNINVSLNRDAEFNIGTRTLSGGAFEVGNPVSVAGGSVSFSFTTVHPDALIHIDRQGFLGLGAGVVNKVNNPNGLASSSNNPSLSGTKAALNSSGDPIFNADTTNAWSIQPLNDVANISLNLQAGTFEHNNIVDGSSPDASLLALGPADSYGLKVNSAELVAIKGGGNMIMVPRGVGLGRANIWDYASPFANGIQYSIMTTAPILFNHESDFPGSTDYYDGLSFNITSQLSMFNALTPKLYNLEEDKYAAFQASAWSNRVGVIAVDSANVKYPATKNIIARITNVDLKSGSVQTAAIDGTVECTMSDDEGLPNEFGALSSFQT